ncbi:hypothetical protein N9H39_08805, partial [Gammaproteobacteria bacterium]|nr:hypothetical protein [Gammaproteobacteria bacterium]
RNVATQRMPVPTRQTVGACPMRLWVKVGSMVPDQVMRRRGVHALGLWIPIKFFQCGVQFS